MLSVFITPWMKPTCIHCAIRRSLALDHGLQQREERLRPTLRAAGSAARSCSRPAGAPVRCRRARRSTRTCRRGCGLRPRGSVRHRAARCSRYTGSPVATTASARVVGMPSACIASPISTSRSIGPTAALPSPPRAERRSTGSLEGDVAPTSLPVDHLAQQQRTAVAQAVARIRRTGDRRTLAPAVARPRAAHCRRTSRPTRRCRAMRRPCRVRRRGSH